jgi:hypothetical protein
MTTPAEASEPVSVDVEPAAATAAAATISDATAPATAPVEPSKAQEMMEEQAQRQENGGNGGVDTWHGGGRKVGMDILVKAE